MTRIRAYCKLAFIKFVRLIAGTPGDWAKAEKPSDKDNKKPGGKITSGVDYDPEEEVFKTGDSKFKTFWDQLSAGNAIVKSAHIMVAQREANGRIKDYKMVKIENATKGKKATITESDRKNLTESATKLIEDAFSQDDYSLTGNYDSGNYTEYVPLLGGPFFRQMYLTDMLAAHQKSFEAYNHNPLARRLIKIIKQYAIARGYKVQSKDPAATETWNAFDKKFKILEKIRKGWTTDYLLFSEFFLDKEKLTSIDPSTIWDIITDPEDIDNVYYYYQSFQTAFQQFTGFDVKGVPGSKDVKPIEYIIRQIPYDRIYHLKADGASCEKRGRPTLYPCLAWLKRFKDYWNAEMARAWVQASYVYDVSVNGSASDVAAIAAADDISKVPAIGSSYVHNEAVKRELLTPGSSGGAGHNYLSDQLISIIAFCYGIPKEHLNVSGSGGGGGRATALVASEPFTKVIEEMRDDITELLQELASIAFKLDGKEYNDELEFIFPSTVKDTTTETIKNIATGETQKYISHKRASTMYASEMDVTIYDYEEEMQSIKDEQEQALDLGIGGNSTAGAPAGRFGDGIGTDDGTSPGKTELHGQGKVDLQKQMNNL